MRLAPLLYAASCGAAFSEAEGQRCATHGEKSRIWHFVYDIDEVHFSDKSKKKSRPRAKKKKKNTPRAFYRPKCPGKLVFNRKYFSFFFLVRPYWKRAAT
jgi:hypothetical protein